jgi:hypothetical protein
MSHLLTQQMACSVREHSFLYLWRDCLLRQNSELAAQSNQGNTGKQMNLNIFPVLSVTDIIMSFQNCKLSVICHREQLTTFSCVAKILLSRLNFNISSCKGKFELLNHTLSCLSDARLSSHMYCSHLLITIFLLFCIDSFVYGRSEG